MKNSTLVHIINEAGCVLMMHRTVKKNDANHGKWIGVGGKFEEGESPEECMRREVMEETGLRIDKYRYCGIVTFVSDDDETEYMHLFNVTAFHGELKTCEEGELRWLPMCEPTQIPHWVGDRIFLSLVLYDTFLFFTMKLVYEKGILKKAVLNEHNCLVTDRLILRPWLPEDAEALYEEAKNPHIGPIAGWPAHRSPEESREVIRDILTAPETYAIVLRDTPHPIGAIGLMNFRLIDEAGEIITGFDERKSADPTVCTKPEANMWDEAEEGSADMTDDYSGDTSDKRSGDTSDERSGDTSDEHSANETDEYSAGDNRICEGVNRIRWYPDGVFVEAELAYWLGEAYWHQGIIQEATGVILCHAREDLHIHRIRCGYFEGNERSKHTQEKLGFVYHHIDEHRYIEAMGEERREIISYLNL